MAVPVFPLLCRLTMAGGGVVIAGGAIALRWYNGLSPEDKASVDAAAVFAAVRETGKAVAALTGREAKEVLGKVIDETGAPVV